MICLLSVTSALICHRYRHGLFGEVLAELLEVQGLAEGIVSLCCCSNRPIARAHFTDLILAVT